MAGAVGYTVVCITMAVSRLTAALMGNIMAMTRWVVRVLGLGFPKMDQLHRQKRKCREKGGYPFYVVGQCHGLIGFPGWTWRKG